MTSKTIVIETLEELVSWIVRNRGYASTKWSLSDFTTTKFVNEEEGMAWRTLWNEEEIRLGWNTPEFEAAKEELRECTPEQHQVTEYNLTECGRDWHAKHIKLGEELGKLVDEVWTRKPEKWNPKYTRRIGNLTIAGILKRLGNTEVSAKIEAAEKAEKLQNEKNGRNYARRELVKNAKAIKEMLEKNPELGLSSNISVEMLLSLTEE